MLIDSTHAERIFLSIDNLCTQYITKNADKSLNMNKQFLRKDEAFYTAMPYFSFQHVHSSTIKHRTIKKHRIPHFQTAVRACLSRSTYSVLDGYAQCEAKAAPLLQVTSKCRTWRIRLDTFWAKWSSRCPLTISKNSSTRPGSLLVWCTTLFFRAPWVVDIISLASDGLERLSAAAFLLFVRNMTDSVIKPV